jgi:ActR/RegA family two-component response regulator
MHRILIVEDEDKLRMALRRGLTEVGYDVTAPETVSPRECPVLPSGRTRYPIRIPGHMF